MTDKIRDKNMLRLENVVLVPVVKDETAPRSLTYQVAAPDK